MFCEPCDAVNALIETEQAPPVVVKPIFQRSAE
jgi:hypothetical protein